MDFVKEEYRAMAEDEVVRNNKELMELTGYNSKQLDKLPPDAIMGISCGNPVTECDLLCEHWIWVAVPEMGTGRAKRKER